MTCLRSIPPGFNSQYLFLVCVGEAGRDQPGDPGGGGEPPQPGGEGRQQDGH